MRVRLFFVRLVMLERNTANCTAGKENTNEDLRTKRRPHITIAAGQESSYDSLLRVRERLDRPLCGLNLVDCRLHGSYLAAAFEIGELLNGACHATVVVVEKSWNVEQKLNIEEKLALALHRNLLILLGKLPLRQIAIKLL